MKKFLSFMACFAIVLVGGFMLASCGQKAPVRLASGDVTIGEGETAQVFNNGKKLKIDAGKEANTYVVTGTANVLTAEQAELWGTSEEGAVYVILEIEFKAGATVTNTGSDGDPKTWTNTTDKDDVLQLVRVVKNKDAKFEAEVKEKDAEEAVKYTVTFDLTNFDEAE